MSKPTDNNLFTQNPFARLFGSEGEGEGGVPAGFRILFSVASDGGAEDAFEPKSEEPPNGRWYDAATRLEADGITKGYNIKQAIDMAFGQEIFNAIRAQWKNASDGTDWIELIQQRLGALASSNAHLEAENKDLRKNVGELLQYLSEAKADKDAMIERVDELVEMLDERGKHYRRKLVVQLLRFATGQEAMPELPTKALKVEKEAARFAEVAEFLSDKNSVPADFVMSAYLSETPLADLWVAYQNIQEPAQVVVDEEQAVPEAGLETDGAVAAEAVPQIAEEMPVVSEEAPAPPSASEPADEKGDYI